MTLSDPTTTPFRNDLVDDHAVVSAWVSATLGDVSVADALADGTDGTVALVVDEVVPVEDRRPDRDLPIRLAISYSVVPPAGMEGAAMVARLLVAAREAADLEVVDEVPTPEWWLARATPPRPVVRLRTVVVIQRLDADRAQRVTEPLVVEIVPSGALRGTVVDDHGRVLAGAVVRLVATGARCETDRHGTFTIPAVGLERRHDITVAARGVTYAGSIPAGAPRDVEIRCTPETASPEPATPEHV